MGAFSLGVIATLAIGAFFIAMGFSTGAHKANDIYIGVGFGGAIFALGLLMARIRRNNHAKNIVTLDNFLANKAVNKVNEVDTEYARLWIDTSRQKMAILLKASSLYHRPDIFAQNLPVVVSFSEIDNWQHTWDRSSSGTISNNVLEIRTFRHDLPVIKVDFLRHADADAFSQRLRIFLTPQTATA